jgi:hypothetical protein
MTISSINSALRPLERIVTPLIGQPCSKVQFIYGDVLCLHFGDLLPYPQKSMTGKLQGTWVLSVVAAGWQWESGSRIIRSAQERSNIEPDLQQLIGQQRVGLQIVALQTHADDSNLDITFNDGSKFQILAEMNDAEDLPQWQLSTPDEQLLEVWTGNRWSYGSIHQMM